MSGPILLLGCGNMGRAMLDGWIAQGISPGEIAVIDPQVGDLPSGVRHLRSPPDRAAVVVLAVKPQKMEEVAPLLSAMDSPQTLLLSILASIEFSTLRRAMPNARAIIRSVPNLPAAIGAGMTGLVADRKDSGACLIAGTLCKPLGTVAWLADEDACHAATAIWGCGPAYVFRFAEALIHTGVEAGLDPALARQAAIETLLGSARLLSSCDTSPAELAQRVASPNGVTMAALRALDDDDAFMRIMRGAVDAALHRSREMGMELNGTAGGV